MYFKLRCRGDFFFFFLKPILFWNTSPRLSPVVATSHYICETYGKQRLPHISPSPHQESVLN
jgi:hypothetical protein